MEGFDITTSGKIAGAVGAMVAIMATFFNFFSRYQTKADCTISHKEHDKLDIERQKTRDEKLGRIHDTVERTEKLVLKMAGDFYKPRVEDTRRGDSE